MAWTRKDGKFFSESQRQKMRDLAAGGMTAVEIAEAAGCAPRSVRYILREGEEAPPKKTRKKKKQLIMQDSPYDPATNSVTEENAYLRWLISGAVNHINGSSYVDRLVKDFSEGKFIP